MDLDARIRRRQRRESEPRLVQDHEALSPVAHVAEPSDRGPVFERLLDHLDPVFDGTLPPNAYLHGPFGAGKSAVVTALFAHLDRLSADAGSVIHTSTRAASPPSPGFVYVDLRKTTSEFAFYRRVLDALVDESVPRHGISTDALRERLHALLGSSRAGVVVALDHVEADDLVGLLAGLPSNVSWLAVGRQPPAETPLSEYTATSIRVDAYQRQMLVDVLMTRASVGLARQAVDHEHARRIAEWADGNAHDALAALFVAVGHAERADRTRLTDGDVAAGIEDVPTTGVSLARALSLPANKQLVLRRLVDLSADERGSVSATTNAISGRADVDLSQSTVERFLYEMSEDGVAERVQADAAPGKGRPPSRIELRFSPTAFRRLYDLAA